MALAVVVAQVQLKRSKVPPTLCLFPFWHVPPWSAKSTNIMQIICGNYKVSADRRFSKVPSKAAKALNQEGAMKPLANKKEVRTSTEVQHDKRAGLGLGQMQE